MFDNFIGNLLCAAIAAWLAEWLFPNILAAVFGVTGMASIGTFELVMFLVFVGLSINDGLKARARANQNKNDKSDDDKS